MYCVKRINDDLFWVGGTDRRLALFENAYPIPRGVSYNAYLLLDEKTVLFDTVDSAVEQLKAILLAEHCKSPQRIAKLLVE